MKRALLLCLALAWASRVEARADFVLRTDGDGFADTTAVQAVGGNAGTTRGEQRRRALARALEIWGAALDSPVPIVVRATFKDLGCTSNGAVLGQAYAVQFMRNLPDEPPSAYYPSALADRIVGRDLAAGSADLAIELNSAIDDDCEHIAGPWYYGVDGKTPTGQNDLIQVALHELAHGLGFSSTVDPRTGSSQFDQGLDVFSARMLDLDLNKHWDELSDEQRASSATNVRRLVFDGEYATAMARELLQTGVPTLSLTPMPAGVSLLRAVSDVELATNPASSPVSGPLVLADPSDACTGLDNDVRGAVVLLDNGPDCAWQDALANLTQAGAAAAVYLVAAPATTPSEPLDAYGYGKASTVRAVTVANETGVAIFNALQKGPIDATLAGDPNARLGADAQGRPLLFASQLSLPGSSLSHFDSLARPNLLMEAYVQGGANHDVDLTMAVLRDIGWERDCGNGIVDADEQCDLGDANSDAPGTSCRGNCRTPGCGDGVKDGAESCDDGERNSDIKAGACRTSCQRARCGDGVMDPGEVCDQGIGNSDSKPDTCRTSCKLPSCGDGVLDADEGCDGTAHCSRSCQALPVDAGVRDAAAPSEASVDTEPQRRGEGCELGGRGWALTLSLLALYRSWMRRNGRAASSS